MESLEPRRLFAASAETFKADAAQLVSECKATRVVLSQEKSAELADRKRIAADLRPLSRTNARLVAQLERAESGDWARIFSAQSALVAQAAALSGRAAADADLLPKRPSNTTVQARVTSDIAALGTKLPLRLTALENRRIALDQALIADATTLSGVNPLVAALPADMQALTDDLGAGAAELGATSALVQVAIQALASDVLPGG